ncbi:hypothetical protein CPB85DRAFT_1514388 [Mucidula mucida]|nr:hypothetical protein CPB85DRAFT_1514388 [Mucidula mucida]
MMPPDPYATRKYWDPVDWTNSFTILPSFLTFAVIMRGRYVDDIDSSEGFFNPVSTEKPTLEESLIDALHSMKNLRALRWEMTEGHLLPALTSLVLVWAEERQPVDALIPMLYSRAGQGGGMHSVSSVVLGVRNGGDLRSDVLECMANLRQHGVRATLW